MFYFFVALLLCVCCVHAESDSPPAEVITRGHSHNDYERTRPLFDALDNGFCSVEADVFLVDDALLVAHIRLFVNKNRTLESLYLEPLRERARKFDGKIFPGAERFYLWVELKTDPQTTYTALKKVLEKYADILTRYENGKEIPGAVNVVLTGNANLNLIKDEPMRYAAVNGGVGYLHSDVSPHLVPFVNLHWQSEFPRFRGEWTAEQKEKLAEQVRQAHDKGRKLRYWGAPDHEAFWNVLYDAGVDLINTDRPERFRKFITKK